MYTHKYTHTPIHTHSLTRNPCSRANRKCNYNFHIKLKNIYKVKRAHI